MIAWLHCIAAAHLELKQLNMARCSAQAARGPCGWHACVCMSYSDVYSDAVLSVLFNLCSNRTKFLLAMPNRVGRTGHEALLQASTSSSLLPNGHNEDMWLCKQRQCTCRPWIATSAVCV